MKSRLPVVLAGLGLMLGFVACTANSSESAGAYYQDVRKMLFSGRQVLSIFSPNLCSNAAGDSRGAATQSGASQGGLWVRDFLELNGSVLAFSNEHLTVKPDGTSVREVIQYRFKQDNTATITVRTLSPTSYEQLSEPKVFACKAGEGLRFVRAPPDAVVFGQAISPKASQ